MEKINGIIYDGKVFVTTKDANRSCLKCDLIEEDGRCVCPKFCAQLGVETIFRYSQELTDKINEK